MNEISAYILAFFGLKKRLLTRPEILDNIERVKAFFTWFDISSKDYLRHSEVKPIKDKYADLSGKINKYYYHKLEDASVEEFLKIFSNFDEKIQEKNSAYVKRQLWENKTFFENIDGKALDLQQQIAVVTDEDNNLVLAGAGSGKTLVVAAKVKYLVEKKNVDPASILLISYTKKSAEEMKKRVNERLHIPVEAKTFHKLGLDIISESRGIKPEVLDGRQFIFRNANIRINL